ncbi:MAG: hypothetical protein N2Z63_06455 [Thiobacillaceae bacterium]|nr:hypothetical protein [Thiobacillaceae bacterium]
MPATETSKDRHAPVSKPLRASRAALPIALAALLTTGCVNDTASYLIEGSREHTIMLHRVQNWIWQDNLTLTVVARRMPDCQGGLDIKGVPRRVRPELYAAPPEYAEPIYILKLGKRHYAVSTLSCRVQAFKEPPAELGHKLGVFAEKNGRFAFHPAKDASASAPDPDAD